MNQTITQNFYPKKLFFNDLVDDARKEMPKNSHHHVLNTD